MLAGEKRPRVLPWHRKLSVVCSILGFRAPLHASGIVHNKFLFELPENEFSQLQVPALQRKLFSEQHGKSFRRPQEALCTLLGTKIQGAPYGDIYTHTYIYTYTHTINIYIYNMYITYVYIYIYM